MSGQAREIPGRQASSVITAVRENAWAIGLALAVTGALHLTIYFLARRKMSPDHSAAATVLLSALWVFIAAPVFAASARTPLGGFLRGGTVIDASVVALVVLAAGSSPVGWMGALKIYLILAAVALAQCALVWTGGSVRARHLLAAAAVLLVLAVSAGPFWANGAIMTAPDPWRSRAAYAVVAANPVFAFTGCLAEGRFLWQQSPILYEFTVLGRDTSMQAAGWYTTAAIYAVGASAIGAAALARRSGRPA